MIKLHRDGVFLVDGRTLVPHTPEGLAKAFGGQCVPDPREAAKGCISYPILTAHDTIPGEKRLSLTFDCLASHDITYVGIIQTARASGLERFPLPYILTNCHNSLCAVGGTINEDDHMFGLSAAQKYGGIYVPAHQAVIHQYMRERHAACGQMILGSDSHTRYGALGTMAIGEGGPELVKQLLGKTYDIAYPDIVCVHLTGRLQRGVGPQDVALALIRAVFKEGFVKNKILEFVGDGIAGLSMDTRIGIDVMTTETTCLSSIWQTDTAVKDYLEIHGRPEAYRELTPAPVAYYDGAVEIDLSQIEPMIALPFHPSNAYPISALGANAADILDETVQAARKQLEGDTTRLTLADKIGKDGRLRVEQGVIAGCAGGTYENICAAADILKGQSVGNGTFALSVYPSSQPISLALMKNGAMADLMAAGASIRSAFCGPCFGAGDVPANNAFSIRHSTRNFPNREGSQPATGQIAWVALMDARSIAATAAAGGILTSGADLDRDFAIPRYYFDPSPYESRVYNGVGRPRENVSLQFGPNIADWPAMSPLPDHLLLQVCALITDPVTTTDELIPSGETSSYRSNPYRLAEYTLSRKAPDYVQRAKAVALVEKERVAGRDVAKLPLMAPVYEAIAKLDYPDKDKPIGVGSVIYATKPGDGSAREQAASCQKVLGGWANIAEEYATKRYRSNLVNWGMLPFLLKGKPGFGVGDYLFIPGVREAVSQKTDSLKAYIMGRFTREITLSLPDLTAGERKIILAGCLINDYRQAR